MDEIFSKRPYLVVRILGARDFVRKKRNRNERQRSRNLLMRNLLTAFGMNRNHEMRRKIILSRLKIFSTGDVEIFLYHAPAKICLRKNFVLMYATVRCADKTFPQKSDFFLGSGEKFALLRSRDAMQTESPQFCCFLSLSTAAKILASKSI